MDEASADKQRDRGRTTRKLIGAAIEIIRERGYTDLGVNAVAERAGVSKVLIYRYFGDLDGLYRAVAEELDPLQSRAAERMFAELSAEAPPADIIKRTIKDLHSALKDDPLTKQLLIWELNHENAITRAFSTSRETTGLDLTERFRQEFGDRKELAGLDLHALLALVTAGVFYLTLRSDAVNSFNGVDIGSEEGWERIAETVADLIARRDG